MHGSARSTCHLRDVKALSPEGNLYPPVFPSPSVLNPLLSLNLSASYPQAFDEFAETFEFSCHANSLSSLAPTIINIMIICVKSASQFESVFIFTQAP